MLLLPNLVTDLLRVFDEIGIPYLIGGSYASSAWGIPRQTMDIDLSVYLYGHQVDDLVSRLQEDFMLSRSEIEDALASTDEYRTFQLIHFEETFKVDGFLRNTAVEYERVALERGKPLRTTADYVAKVMSPEDVVLTKLRWYELASRVSDRQWNDILSVLQVQADELDVAYMEKWAKHFGVDFTLSLALEEAKLQ